MPARQLPSGTILVDSPVRETGATVAYCRVSSHEQKADLERQAGRVLTGATGRGLSIDRTVANLRRDDTHQLTSRLVRDFDTIVIEDLHVAGMLRNRRLARHIAGAA